MRENTMRSFIFLVATSALAACSPYDPDLGGIPYQCGDTEPKCPSGYSCQDDGNGRPVCVSNSGVTPDAKINGGFVCQDDGRLETDYGQNNDSIDHAYKLDLKNISLGPVSICPAGDKDTYEVNVAAASSTIQATVIWESGDVVNVALLNRGGSQIAVSTSDPENAQLRRAVATNLPVGIYFVQVSAAPDVKNNYKLTVAVTP
jgi:hypothetical protein